MSLQLSEVLERICAVELAGVDQTHEQVADFGAVQCLVEERVFAVQDRFLQGPFHDVMPIPGLCRVHWILEVPQRFRMIANAA